MIPAAAAAARSAAMRQSTRSLPPLRGAHERARRVRCFAMQRVSSPHADAGPKAIDCGKLPGFWFQELNDGRAILYACSAALALGIRAMR